MDTSNAPISLSKLPKNTRDFRKVLGVYLDLRKEYKIDFTLDFLLFRAEGTGKDGEKQTFGMYPNGRIYRYSCGRTLPAEVGKLLCMLDDMGYWLYGANLAQANRYRKYVTTGISNLVKYDSKAGQKIEIA